MTAATLRYRCPCQWCRLCDLAHARAAQHRRAGRVALVANLWEEAASCDAAERRALRNAETFLARCGGVNSDGES